MKFAVTWANFQKVAHWWANENFIRPKLCHSPTQNPFAHINMKFAHFMGGKMVMIVLDLKPIFSWKVARCLTEVS